MKGKQLGILVIAAGILGGLGWYVRSKGQEVSEQSRIGMGDKVLGAFDVNSVGGIRVTAGSNSVNVVKSGDVWTVKERGGYAANFTTISDFVRKLAELKVTKPLSIGASRLTALDLITPDKGAGVLVELLGGDGKLLKSVLLGKKVMRESQGQDNSPFGGGGAAGGFPVGRYIMLGNDPKTAAVVNDALGGSEAKPEDWMAKDFLKVEPPILQVAVVKPVETNSFTLSRTNEAAAWELTELKGEEKTDAGKVSAFGTLLSAPTFTDVVVSPDLAALGLDQPVTATVRTTAGFTYEIKLGKEQTSGGDIPMQVGVKGEFTKERTVGKDEKPEDKTKLDKEFAEKLTKLQEKLKSEQAYSKWTYLVSKWSVDPLLKNRSELLVDKKAETPPAAPPTGLPGGLPEGLPGLNFDPK